MFLYNYKGKLSSFVVKMFIENGFKEVWVFKGFFNLFVFGFKKLWSFTVKNIFIEIRLYNLMMHIIKLHVKIVKIYMVKFNVSILNRFNLNIMSFLIKLQPNLSLFWQKKFSPYLIPTNYLNRVFIRYSLGNLGSILTRFSAKADKYLLKRDSLLKLTNIF